MDLRIPLFILFFQVSVLAGVAQISPGELAAPHAHLEGMSNCTKCHTLGSKISNDKCLACHTEIKARIDKKTGYHSSSQVFKKSCIVCHSDHHGRQYQIIHFDKNKFDHLTTGYKLEGKHGTLQCSDCHESSKIIDPAAKKKKSTYLGLGRECLACHEDYHQKSLSADCSRCHTFKAFKPAEKFDHARAAFKLKGKHSTVECIKCHEKSTINGKVYQKFKGLKFSGCVNCHKDVHNNSFGQKCSDCHVEESFKIIKSISTFDHNLTNFKLEGRHVVVACNKCHKGSYTTPLRHDKCYNCHVDYHKGEFTVQNNQTDCSSCHDVYGFTPSSFSIERHKTAAFKLEGAHVATPCIACHKKEPNWKFRKIGIRCSDCHQDIHKEYLDQKYYPQSNCLTCHSVESWREISFDHNVTRFSLQGKHRDQTCRSCHVDKNNIAGSPLNKPKSETGGVTVIQFTGLPSVCIHCHTDEHQGQFSDNGNTDCGKCHQPEGWLTTKFNHDNARFKLDGRHKDVACIKCHPVVQKDNNQYVLYKTGKITCADCH